MVTMSFPSLKPVEMTKNEMPKGSLHDYLLASAACFPAFPMYKIGGKSYVDGGYYDNLPIDFAIKMGAQRVIAADLGDKPAHPKYQNEPNVIYIFPSQPIGSILNFAQDVMQKNQQMGYFDTLRAFGRVRGFTYSFCPEGVDGEAAGAFWQRVRPV